MESCGDQSGAQLQKELLELNVLEAFLVAAAKLGVFLGWGAGASSDPSIDLVEKLVSVAEQNARSLAQLVALRLLSWVVTLHLLENSSVDLGDPVVDCVDKLLDQGLDILV